MNLRRVILWRPASAAGRFAVAAAGALAVTLLAWLHLVTGLSYEFHVFFIVPILLVAWLSGATAGFAAAALALVLWVAADRFLGGDEASLWPLVVNSTLRAVFFAGGVFLLAEMRRVLDRESRLARLDTLTGLANRREFQSQGQRALAQAARQVAPMTAVFIDLDRFKEVNDTEGHEAGDAVLVTVADSLRAHLRESDIAGRLGGDEFALLLPGMTAAAAGAYADRLRERLLAAMRANGWPVTFSIGVAAHMRAPTDFDGLIQSADALMYEVKHGGRDRVLLREFAVDEAADAANGE